MRSGTESALARVVAVFGAARPHHAYLFANRRANRMKVLVHDGIGVWLAARRLNRGKFVWPRGDAPSTATLSRTQFDALAYEHALEWARMRAAFGKPIFEHQVIRHKLVDMFQRVEASQAMLELTAWRMEQGEDVVAQLCALKNQATQTLAYCASEAVQILGGAGFLRGNAVERIYREVKVNAIGGGTEEIMKELAARHLPQPD